MGWLVHGTTRPLLLLGDREMSKMLTQDEMQYLEHCNKMLRETRGLITEITKETKEALNSFIPIVSEYVSTVRSIQHEFGRTVSNILKDSKELKFVAGNYQEITAYAEALTKLGEVFKTKEVQDVLEIVKKAATHE